MRVSEVKSDEHTRKTHTHGTPSDRRSHAVTRRVSSRSRMWASKKCVGSLLMKLISTYVV